MERFLDVHVNLLLYQFSFQGKQTKSYQFSQKQPFLSLQYSLFKEINQIALLYKNVMFNGNIQKFCNLQRFGE